MLVECPNCHRRYEPKPNEKYCPCCGEDISGKLMQVEQPSIPVQTQISPAVQQRINNSNKARNITLIACLLALFSFLLFFAPSISAYAVNRSYEYYSSSVNSLFQLTFFAKEFTSTSSKPSSYVGLIIAFVIYVAMYGIVIYNTCKCALNKSDAGRVVAGIIQLFLVAFYVIYILAKFKYEYNSGSGSSQVTYKYMPTFEPAFIMFLGSLIVSAVLNFVSAKLD